MTRIQWVKFSSGVVSGFLLYLACYFYIKQHRKHNSISENCVSGEEKVISRPFQTELPAGLQDDKYYNSYFPSKESPVASNKLEDRKTNAGNAGTNLRIVCYILTYEDNHATRGKQLIQTWGKKCDHLFFTSTKNDTEISAIDFGGEPTHSYTYGRSKRGATYAYETYKNEADWYLKADDDTYVIMENLRMFLSSYNTSEPIFFGCRFNKFTEQGYFSGGGGYVMSKEAMRKLVEEGIPDPEKSPQGEHAPEDAKIGITMYNVGVKAMDVRDEQGRYRFFPFNIKRMNPTFRGGLEKWFYDYVYYNYTTGSNCCSPSAITFHYMTSLMYMMDYFLYQVGVYGQHDITKQTNKQKMST